MPLSLNIPTRSTVVRFIDTWRRSALRGPRWQANAIAGLKSQSNSFTPNPFIYIQIHNRHRQLTALILGFKPTNPSSYQKSN